MKNILITSFSFAALFAANVVHAQGQLQNPTIVDGVGDFVSLSLKVLVMVALPVISLFIVYSGFMFVAAQGNPEKLGDAKRNLMYVIAGASLILGAWVIATMIGGTVSQVLR